MDEQLKVDTAPQSGAALQAARWIATLNLATLAGMGAWFAYIDATITDAAMLVLAAGIALSLASVAAALLSMERLLSRGAAAPSGTRSRRLALLLLLLALVCQLGAATATLNLKGGDSDDSDTATATIVPA